MSLHNRSDTPLSHDHEDLPPPSAQRASDDLDHHGFNVTLAACPLPIRKRLADGRKVMVPKGAAVFGAPTADSHREKRVDKSASSSSWPHKTVPAATKTHHVINNPLRPIPAAAAAPVRTTFFDPWNSSSTGHQRAENRLSASTSWRQSRGLKLAGQYRGGLAGGGERIADTVGAGSEDFGKDGKKAGLRERGQTSLVHVWQAKKKNSSGPPMKQWEEEVDDDTPNSLDTKPLDCSEKQLFKGLCFYLNGSTAPLISDHKLKHVLALHGASHSLSLGRRTVTHVILSTTSGGGLAASKIQKELSQKGGKRVRFVTAEWVLSSIKANRRLSESSFAPALSPMPRSQSNILSLMKRPTIANPPPR